MIKPLVIFDKLKIILGKHYMLTTGLPGFAHYSLTPV